MIGASGPRGAAESSKPSTALAAGGRGGEGVDSQLVARVYDELRALASSYLRHEGVGHTLQPTALVHEAYVKLQAQSVVPTDPSHFFAVAAQAMRRILSDHARRRKSARRGGGRRITLRDEHAVDPEAFLDVLALDQAIERLGESHERAARIVELRYFGGLGVEESARALGVSPVTIKRDWRFARAWLIHALSDEDAERREGG